MIIGNLQYVFNIKYTHKEQVIPVYGSSTVSSIKCLDQNRKIHLKMTFLPIAVNIADIYMADIYSDALKL